MDAAWVPAGAWSARVVGRSIRGIMMVLGRKNRHATSADGATGVPWTFAGLSLLANAPSVVDASR